jgi:hypothetical protein
MEAQRWNKYGAAVTVVTRMIDILEVDGRIDAPPQVQCVKRLHDIFAAVVELAVS